MNERCKKCGICCKFIPVDIQTKTVYRDGIQVVDEKFLQNLKPSTCKDLEYTENIRKMFPNIKFYSCKHLSDENLCTIEEKPDICKNFPASAFASIPETCGYIGEIFSKQEEIKQKIRRLKEEIIHYEALMTTNDKDKSAYQKIITSHQKFIDRYKNYGSFDW